MPVKQSVLEAIREGREYCSSHPGVRVYIMDKAGKDAVMTADKADYQRLKRSGWEALVVFFKDAPDGCDAKKRKQS